MGFEHTGCSLTQRKRERERERRMDGVWTFPAQARKSGLLFGQQTDVPSVVTIQKIEKIEPAPKRKGGMIRLLRGRTNKDNKDPLTMKQQQQQQLQKRDKGKECRCR